MIIKSSSIMSLDISDSSVREKILKSFRLADSKAGVKGRFLSGIVSSGMSLNRVINTFKTKDNILGEYSNKLENSLPAKIKEIAASSESKRKLYDSHDLGSGQGVMGSWHSDFKTQVSGLFESIKKKICVSYSEYSSGLTSVESIDNAYFILRYCSESFDHYAEGIRDLVACAEKDFDTDNQSDVKDAQAVFGTLELIKTLYELCSCIKSTANVEEKASSLVQINDLDIKIKSKSTRATKGKKHFDVSDPEEIILDFKGKIKSLRGMINTKRSEQTSRNIYLNGEFFGSSVLDSLENKDGIFTFTVSARPTVGSGTLMRILNKDGGDLSTGQFTIDNAAPQAKANFQFNLSSNFNPGQSSTPPAPPQNSTADDNMHFEKGSFASTQTSSFYEIHSNGKKIVTTISEYISNNGYYNVDGKKVKLKLSDAKPKGISDAKKRNKK